MALDRSEREALIDRYAEGPSRLKAALAKVPAGALQWRPKAGEWSAHEVVVHCADSETNGTARIRYLAAELVQYLEVAHVGQHHVEALREAPERQLEVRPHVLGLRQGPPSLHPMTLSI